MNPEHTPEKETVEQAAKIVLLNISAFAAEYNAYGTEYGLPNGKEYFDVRALQQLQYFAQWQAERDAAGITHLKEELEKVKAEREWKFVYDTLPAEDGEYLVLGTLFNNPQIVCKTVYYDAALQKWHSTYKIQKWMPLPKY